MKEISRRIFLCSQYLLHFCAHTLLHTPPTKPLVRPLFRQLPSPPRVIPPCHLFVRTLKTACRDHHPVLFSPFGSVCVPERFIDTVPLFSSVFLQGRQATAKSHREGLKRARARARVTGIFLVRASSPRDEFS